MCHVELTSSQFCFNQGCRYMNVPGMHTCRHVDAALSCNTEAEAIDLISAEEVIDRMILIQTGVDRVKHAVEACPEGVPFLVQLPGGTPRFQHFSIYGDRERAYIHWQSPNKWACSCSNLGSSCIHVLAGKWALYLLSKGTAISNSLPAEDWKDQEILSKYYLAHKRIAADLFYGDHPEPELGPGAITLEPVETACPFCDGDLSLKPVRGRSFIIGLRAASAAHVFMKHCLKCSIFSCRYYYLTCSSAVSISDSYKVWLRMNGSPDLGFDASQVGIPFYLYYFI
jgi:hypothetical protein